jgi:hypothetical protein
VTDVGGRIAAPAALGPNAVIFGSCSRRRLSGRRPGGGQRVPVTRRTRWPYFSTEIAGGFTGLVIGVGAAAGGATIARFAYEPLYRNKPPSNPATAYGF